MVKRVTGPMSVEEHVALGLELHDMRTRLLSIGVTVSNRYGVSKKVGKLLLQSSAQLDKARCELDEQLLRDHGPDVFCPHVYYPGDADSRTTHKMMGCSTCYPKTADKAEDKTGKTEETTAHE